jgi:signal transduction histidine kinase
MTIRKRLTLWYAGLLTIIIVLFGSVAFVVMRVAMIASIDETLDDTARLITINSRLVPVTTFGGPPQIEIELASLNLFQGSGVIVQAWEINEDAPVLKGSSAYGAELERALAPGALGSLQIQHTNVIINGVNLRVITTPIMIGDRLVGNIQVADDLATVNRATDKLLLVMIGGCAIAIVGAAMISMWFSHHALKPIDDLTQAASGIVGANDLSTRLDWDGPSDELGRLVSVFNQMMERIQHLFSVQQRFIADISHELRTPLTSIRGNMELSRRYGMEDDTMEAIEAETERMSRLVSDLLMLARADYGSIEIELYPLDLDTPALEAFEQAKILAKDRDLNIRLLHFEPVRIRGNSDRIKQIVFNLMSNAIKFTPDGGDITVGLEHIDNRAVLWVKDTGEGISKKDCQRIFDRFYQTDESRHHNDGGFGLGLSITKWIVEAHGGTIRVSSQPGEGATFTVSFPVYRDPQMRDVEAEDGMSAITRPRLPAIRLGLNRDASPKRDAKSTES